MVDIISKNGMFFKEIPFNMENAKAIQNGSKRGFCMLVAPKLQDESRIIATDLNNTSKPIAIAVMRNESECVVQSDKDGFSCLCGRFRLYVPTKINTYDTFVPSLYQACLIRDPNCDNSSWMIEVCNGYKDDGTPRFFGKWISIEWECVPLCKATLPLLNLCNISWIEYIQTTLMNDED